MITYKKQNPKLTLFFSLIMIFKAILVWLKHLLLETVCIKLHFICNSSSS